MLPPLSGRLSYSDIEAYEIDVNTKYHGDKTENGGNGCERNGPKSLRTGTQNSFLWA